MRLDLAHGSCRASIISAVLLVTLLGVQGFAETEDSEPDPWVPVEFVILRSTPDYAEALRIAERAATQLAIPLDLRGLIFDPTHGLTWPRERCEEGPLYPFPCYFPRGRFDSGVYLSVERSDAYASFRPGLFIVIAASGEPGSAEIASSLTKAQAIHPDSYVKKDKVYHGCMH